MPECGESKRALKPNESYLGNKHTVRLDGIPGRLSTVVLRATCAANGPRPRAGVDIVRDVGGTALWFGARV